MDDLTGFSGADSIGIGHVSIGRLFVNTSIFCNSEMVEMLTHYGVDFLSNGFKFRSSSNRNNGSGQTYIYYAVAENPFQANGGLAR